MRISLLTLLLLTTPALAADYDLAPIFYPKAPADNVINQLQERLNEKKTTLKFDDDTGYIKALLHELNVPISSQVLVFSKTSLQRDKIAPRTPRALYFNDDVYLGFCLRGEVCEISVADPNLGTVFYSLDQEPVDNPRFQRQTDNCLICHGSSLTRGMPGHLVRSVYPDTLGNPILSAGTHRIDHTSPFKDRWGGWYVTGTHGKQTHLGNLIVRNRRDADEGTYNPDGQNLTDLRPKFASSSYLSKHSDIVALMVLEHQSEMHNRITRATLETRMALHYQDELNKAMGEPMTTRYDSVKSRIKTVGEDLLRYMLFDKEMVLTDPVKGTTTFAEDFAARSPKDAQGRSLRQFDLQTRLFRYRCSYLIYSKAFDGMPTVVKDQVLNRLYEVLTAKDTKEFPHISLQERGDILAILRETKQDLPDYWKAK